MTALLAVTSHSIRCWDRRGCPRTSFHLDRFRELAITGSTSCAAADGRCGHARASSSVPASRRIWSVANSGKPPLVVESSR
eukprot:1093564-Prymnesium_polylepis.1